jgi:hypothetical protein
MKRILLSLVCLVSSGIQALEYEPQYENDQISVAKVKIQPHEETQLHRDAYPQIVIALKGGTLTRLETDGQATEVSFPTAMSVVLDADPQDELHKSVNNSSEPIELIVIQLKNHVPLAKNKKENSHDISVSVKINCPTSDEFQAFMKSIPPSGNYASSLNEWKSSFVNNMNQLIHLVESEKIFHSSWSVNTDQQLPQAANVE